MYTVLIVEDEKFNRDHISRFLRKRGFVTFEVSDGSEALEFLESNWCDVISLDIQLPRVDGVEFLNIVKKSARLSGVPVVVVSCYCLESDIQRFFALGASYFLAKPIEFLDCEVFEKAASAHVCARGCSLTYMNSEGSDGHKNIDVRSEPPEDVEPSASPVGLKRDDSVFLSLIHDLKNHAIFILNQCNQMEDCPKCTDLDGSLSFAKAIKQRAQLLLDMAKDAHSMSANIDFSKIDINALLEEVCLSLSSDVYDFRFRLDGHVPDIMGNRSRLKVLFSNVIQNSMQAMPAGGEVFVSTFVAQKEVYVKIFDRGCGMSEEAIERVFEIDYSTKDMGGGVGLYLVKMIADEHNARLSVRSKIDLGTSVSVMFKVQ